MHGFPIVTSMSIQYVTDAVSVVGTVMLLIAILLELKGTLKKYSLFFHPSNRIPPSGDMSRK